MIDKIENSSGTQGVDKCNGCQKTVPLAELFRCTTCVQHSASTVDAVRSKTELSQKDYGPAFQEIRVCSMCIVMSHSRHDYQKLDVALKMEVLEKIDGFLKSNDAKKTILKEEKDSILIATGELEKV